MNNICFTNTKLVKGVRVNFYTEQMTKMSVSCGPSPKHNNKHKKLVRGMNDRVAHPSTQFIAIIVLYYYSVRAHTAAQGIMITANENLVAITVQILSSTVCRTALMSIYRVPHSLR